MISKMTANLPSQWTAGSIPKENKDKLIFTSLFKSVAQPKLFPGGGGGVKNGQCFQLPTVLWEAFVINWGFVYESPPLRTLGTPLN